MDKTAKKVLEYITGQGVEYFGTFVDTYLQEMASDIGIGKTELSAALVYLKEKTTLNSSRHMAKRKTTLSGLRMKGCTIKKSDIWKRVSDGLSVLSGSSPAFW